MLLQSNLGVFENGGCFFLDHFKWLAAELPLVVVFTFASIFGEKGSGYDNRCIDTHLFRLEKMKIKFENILTPYINQPKEYKLVLPKLDKIN